MNARTLQTWCNHICDLCGIAKTDRPKIWYKKVPTWLSEGDKKYLLGKCEFDAMTTGEIWVSYKGHKGRGSWIWHTLGHEVMHQVVDKKGIRFQSEADEERMCDTIGRVLMELIE